jgi:hypothetical protein
MMLDDLFTPEETAVIQRLRHAPPPELKPQAFRAIQQRLLQELDALSGRQPPSQPRSMPAAPIVLAIGVVVVVIIIVVSVLVASQQKPSGTLTLTPPPGFTATPAPAPSVVVGKTSAGPASQGESQPTQEVPGSTVQATSGATAGSTATPEATEPAVILVLEGPVQKVSSDGITVFDMEIRLDPDDPILKLIQVGKMVHVEGYPETSNGVIVVIVINIVIQNDNPAVSPGLPPGCKMSKNGHIKCSKKER